MTEQLEAEDLTPAGWPRPVVDGWPIPWVSPAHALATMDIPRLRRAASGKICAVCGLDHQPTDAAYIVVSGPKPPHDVETLAQAMDNAVMHLRCLKLAVGKCPTLLRMIRENRLLVLEVISEDTVFEEPPEDFLSQKMTTRFPVTRCKVVASSDGARLVFRD